MIRNGPNTRLSSAPGRRTTSITSFVMKAVVRVQLLSSPTMRWATVPVAHVSGGVVVWCDQPREHLVEGRSVLAARFDMNAEIANRLDDARCGRTGIVDHEQQMPRRVLAHLAHALHLL